MSNNKQIRRISQQTNHSGTVYTFRLYDRVRPRDGYVADTNTCVNRNSVCTNLSDITYSREGSGSASFSATDGVLSYPDGTFCDRYKKCAATSNAHCNILRHPIAGYRRTLGGSKCVEYKRILRDNKSRANCHSNAGSATQRNENLKASNGNGTSNHNYAQYLKRKTENINKCETKVSTGVITTNCCEVRRITPIIDKKCNYNC